LIVEKYFDCYIFHISKDSRGNKQYIRDITVITEEESGKMSQMRRALGSGYVQGTGFFLLFSSAHIEISENGPILSCQMYLFS